ncbi:MAG: tRNA (N(6)-L-threonylcarbamoyladenosine(37)-C(2))-methylthiotransferase MtaB [Clostridiales bacterium]|jgi:threonylcarbamoyladenosine tRNA methylthiotransferase MtaB|nr:tRNA (N(6)-L-threonylcarbamoyladenosine(37)-C(2))-methylthiotransferase MtaB [Clostridiales bacterium]
MYALFHTFGCKVNQYETQAMRRILEREGWRTGEYAEGSEAEDDCLVIVVNSCTVTGESDRKLKQFLRRIRREHPTAILILTGCMPQAYPEVADGFAEADIVLGNTSRSSLPRQINRYLTIRQRIVEVSRHSGEFEPLSIDEFQGRTRAFVKIEDGCDRFCSYCIIPYARGRVRSKPLKQLKAELETLAGRGFCEIVLVGINLTAYGREWGGSVCDAVKLASEVSGIRRVRLGSLEPDLITPDVIEQMASIDKLCPQFHLSLQSGCADTLRRMNRRYTPDEYREAVETLRRHFPDCALTTDVMVGFPGEDEREFSQSLEFVQSIGFLRAHVFAYSPRPGTPAAKAPGQVSAAEKSRRSRIMAEACRKSRDRELDKWIGRTAEVLVETGGESGFYEGYTPEYIPVKIKACGTKPPRKPGDIVFARITGHKDGVCEGEPADTQVEGGA